MRMPAIERAETAGPAPDRYVTRDGLRLGLMHWDAQNPFAVIVALHGMSDYSNAFAMPAPFWAEHGITTYAYDQRSFGRSPQPGIWPGNNVMRRDLSDFVDVVKARHPGLPVYVLGESMGGAVVMSAFASDAPPKGMTRSRTNSPFVSVPVLSVQITVVEPSVSTLASRFTSTPCLLRRQAPTLRNSVNTSGNSSGAADIATPIPPSRACPQDSFRKRPSATTARATSVAMTANLFTSRPTRCCNGV